jgi:hypothetical protein
MAWSETTYSPDWTDEDVSAALDYQHERSLICACGHPIDETTNPDDARAWIAEPVVCNACAARERRSSSEKATPPGTKYRTRNRAKD